MAEMLYLDFFFNSLKLFLPMLSIVNLPLPEKLILMLRNASCSYLTGECW